MLLATDWQPLALPDVVLILGLCILLSLLVVVVRALAALHFQERQRRRARIQERRRQRVLWWQARQQRRQAASAASEKLAVYTPEQRAQLGLQQAMQRAVDLSKCARPASCMQLVTYKDGQAQHSEVATYGNWSPDMVVELAGSPQERDIAWDHRPYAKQQGYSVYWAEAHPLSPTELEQRLQSYFAYLVRLETEVTEGTANQSADGFFRFQL